MKIPYEEPLDNFNRRLFFPITENWSLAYRKEDFLSGHAEIKSYFSDRLIVIHFVKNKELLMLEYYFYKVHVFGWHRKEESLPDKLDFFLNFKRF